MKELLNLFDFKQKINYKTEILSGLTVALALVPEAVAFSLIAGLSPLTGLYAAFTIGLITSIFGGRPGMISGATGAVAVVIVALAKSHGVEYVFAAVVLAGVIQMLAGVLKLGKLIRLVPHPVMFGFVNGLAIIIFLSQLDQFKFKTADGSLEWMTGTPLLIMVGLVALTMLIIWGLPRLTKAVPASLVAILTVFCGGGGTQYRYHYRGRHCFHSGGLSAFQHPQSALYAGNPANYFPLRSHCGGGGTHRESAYPQSGG